MGGCAVASPSAFHPSRLRFDIPYRSNQGMEAKGKGVTKSHVMHSTQREFVSVSWPFFCRGHLVTDLPPLLSFPFVRVARRRHLPRSSPRNRRLANGLTIRRCVFVCPCQTTSGAKGMAITAAAAAAAARIHFFWQGKRCLLWTTSSLFDSPPSPPPPPYSFAAGRPLLGGAGLCPRGPCCEERPAPQGRFNGG